MKRPVTMPALSDTMNNGRLTRWLKQLGDAVKAGDAIAEVETDKAVMEVEAFHDGYLAGPLAEVNAELPVGQTIGYIADAADEAVAAASASPMPASPPAAAVPVAAAVAPASATVQRASSPRETPPATAGGPGNELSARARARARHYADAPGGEADLQVAAKPTHDMPEPAHDAPQPLTQARAANKPVTEIHPASALDALLADGPPYRIERAPSMREAVAHNIAGSAATPTFRVTARLSLDAVRALAAKQDISLTVLLARACAAAITAHPLFNAAFTPQGLAHRTRIDIGIAVDGPDSLFTPILRDVAGRSAAELAGDWRALLGKVKSKRLSLTDYRGATFYLSNLGVFDVVQSFDAVVPSGASAILSVAANRADGACFTLSCDHRVVFGADAARFLQSLEEVLSSPEKLI
jgi:pyruvate dehydrogenase E2 component (dihydrolipoamide acetyltransferase)